MHCAGECEEDSTGLGWIVLPKCKLPLVEMWKVLAEVPRVRLEVTGRAVGE